MEKYQQLKKRNKDSHQLLILVNFPAPAFLFLLSTARGVQCPISVSNLHIVVMLIVYVLWAEVLQIQQRNLDFRVILNPIAEFGTT